MSRMFWQVFYGVFLGLNGWFMISAIATGDRWWVVIHAFAAAVCVVGLVWTPEKS